MNAKSFFAVVCAVSCFFASAAAEWDVASFGALNDGASDATGAIQKAIDECSLAGGGVVRLAGGGTYLSSRLVLKNGVELSIGRDTVLKCSDDMSKFPEFAPTDVWRWDRPVRWNRFCFIYACGATNIAVTGEGVIDGSSTSPKFHVLAGGAYVRTSDTNIVARGIFFAGCKGVRMENVLYRDACGWATFFLDCDDVRVRGVRIRCNRNRPNGDGLHFGGCRDVHVENCDIDANDDAIIIRSHQEQMRVPRPCERVTVSNCRLRSNQFAVRFGWTGDAPVKDCLFRGIECPYSLRGIGFSVPKLSDPEYSRDPPRGNGIPPPDFPLLPFSLENVRFENMRLLSHTLPFGLAVGAGERVAYMRNVSFSNCTFVSQWAPVFKVRPQDNVSDWRFEDVEFRIEKPRGSLPRDTGVWFDNASGIVMERVRWSCTVREDPEWSIRFRQTTNSEWELYRDKITGYHGTRRSTARKLSRPVTVSGAAMRPATERLGAGHRRFVYGGDADGSRLRDIAVTIDERAGNGKKRFNVRVENSDRDLEVLGITGPYVEAGDFDPKRSSLTVCGAAVTEFPESAAGLGAVTEKSAGWCRSGDREPRRRKEADTRVSSDRVRTAYVSPWCGSPSVEIVSGGVKSTFGTDVQKADARAIVRYDSEYGTVDVAFEYRCGIRSGESAGFSATAAIGPGSNRQGRQSP